MQTTQTDYNYELLFELSPDLLCIAGYDGYFKKVNAAVSKTLGYSVDELYARPINDFVFDEDKRMTANARLELTKAKPLHNFENRYVTKNGETVWLSWTSVPVEDDQLIFAIAKNITHKKNIELGRNELLANLTQMNTDLKHLSFMISHDLRSPVNNLLSVCELLDMSKIDDEETLALLGMLRISIKNVKLSLNNHVDVLIEKHGNNSKMEVLLLESVLDNVLKALGSLIKSSKVIITADFSKADEIRFNEIYLYSVFLNLITNSIKYSRPDRIATISIKSDKINGFTRLVIEDNGMGLNIQEVRGRIFGFRQQLQHQSDSKGVGLYLVHNHVTSLGGEIKIESTLNQGTKFTILLVDF